MNADKDNTGEGSKSSGEDAIRKRAQRLVQTCDDYLSQCDDVGQAEDTTPDRPHAKPCMLKRIWLSLTNKNH